MNDTPSSVMNAGYHGQTLHQLEKDDEFELMLTAIEENSGHTIVLGTIRWGRFFRWQYDCTKSMHSRINMKKINSYCFLSKS